MNAVDIKEKFHGLIDLIDNDEVLENFYQALNDYRTWDKNKDIIDDLTDAQAARLDESIQQSNTGKTIPHEFMKTEIRQWLDK